MSKSTENNMNNSNGAKHKAQRIISLDTLRGILLILVVLFHLFYDLHFIFGVRLGFMERSGIYVFRDCFVSLLIFISGVCCNLSRSNIKRGIKTFGCGLLISVVTGLVIPEEFVLFGILHFFGMAMMLYGAVEKAFEKWHFLVGWRKIIGVITMLALFGLTFHIYQTDIGEFGGALKYLLFIAGFNTGCSSADYYPLLPWIFMFFAGGIAGRGIKEQKLPKLFYGDYCPPVTWIGKNTLWIYLVHQPVMYGILYVFFVLLK